MSDTSLFDKWQSQQKTKDTSMESVPEPTEAPGKGSMSSFDAWNKSVGGPESDLGLVVPNTDIDAEPSLWESLNTPTAPQEWDWTNVGLSTAIGAGVGTAIAPGPGTVGGAVSGFASGMAGEMSRRSGNRPLYTFGLELFGGAGPAAGKMLLQKGVKSLGVFLPYKGQKAVNLFASSTPEQKAIIAAKRASFGDDVFDGLYSTKHTDALNVVLREKLFKQGINVGENQKASDVFRETLFKDIFKRSSQGTAPELGIDSFTRSPEVTDLLLGQLIKLQKVGDIKKHEVVHIKKILDSLVDTDATVRAMAPDKLINLIQSGGSYSGLVKGEVQRKIGDPAQKALKEAFDAYLERVTGAKGYSVLKNIEQQEFIALAQDSIPTIVDTGFSFGTKAFSNALDNIAQSPTGKQEFVKAINQHFANFGEAITQQGKTAGREISRETLMKEFHRLRPAIEKSGVMSKEALIALREKLLRLPGQVKKQQWMNSAADLIKKATIGSMSAEMANQASDKPLFML